MKPRVLVSSPSPDDWDAEYGLALLGMLAVAHSVCEPVYQNVRSTYIEVGRNRGAETAIEGGFDYVFLLDSDMGFPPDALSRLLAANEPIVGATYLSRRPPYEVHGASIESGELTTATSGLVPMLKMPDGFLLIRRDVLEAIGEPYFSTFWEGKRFHGQDFRFCTFARAKGFNVFCDVGLSHEITHRAKVGLRWGANGAVEFTGSGE